MKKFLKLLGAFVLATGILSGCTKASTSFEGIATKDEGDGVVSITNGEWKEDTKYRVSVNYVMSNGTIHPSRFHMTFITTNQTFEVYVPEGEKYGVIVSECSNLDTCEIFTDIDQQVIESTNYTTDPEIAPFLVEDIWNNEEAEAKYAMELCEGIDDDYAKLEKIYYYITEEYVYDETIYDEEIGDERMAKAASDTALETFESKSGICQDFARLLIAMTRAVGIPSTGVSGVAGFGGVVENPENAGHEWNRVYVDGEWHTVDATWGLVSSIGEHRDPYVEGEELNYYTVTDDNEY